MRNLPFLARPADYFGLWSYEPISFSAEWEVYQKTDLAAHMRSAQARPQPPARRVGVAGKPQVAVVPIQGTMMKGQSSFGGTSTVMLREEIRQLALDPQVSAILLQIESGGGTVAGTSELAAEVRAARKRKPVHAFVEDLTASAAYWVASQAGAIYANNPLAQVGSIGTIFTVMDSSAAAEKAGVKVHTFTTGPLKGAGMPGTPLTEEQAAHIQDLVDNSQLAFDAAVKQGRSLSDARLAKVRTGGVFPASKALELGLIDGIQSLDATVASLAKIK